MALSGINNTTKLLIKPFSVLGTRSMRRLAGPYEVKTATKDGAVEEQRRTEEGGGWWMPHHRTGIYFPRGQEWVMDDIPTHAASFDCTYWLRSNDGGVDDHLPHHNHDLQFRLQQPHLA